MVSFATKLSKLLLEGDFCSLLFFLGIFSFTECLFVKENAKRLKYRNRSRKNAFNELYTAIQLLRVGVV